MVKKSTHEKFISKSSLLFLLLVFSFLIYSLHAKAQVIRISSNPAIKFSICNGDVLSIHVVNNSASTLPSPIIVYTDFGTDFTDLSFGDSTLASAKKFPSTNLSFGIRGTSTSHYYQIAVPSGLAQGDSIELNVKLRPICGLLQRQFNSFASGVPVPNPPMPMQTAFNFTLNLKSGSTSNSNLFSAQFKPNISLSFPKVSVFTDYKTDINNFTIADSLLCSNCINSTCGNRYYEYLAPKKRFYKFIQLQNSSLADTLDLTNPLTFLHVNESKDKYLQYAIKAIHIKTSTGYKRIAANSMVNNANPISSFSPNLTTPSTFVLHNSTSNLYDNYDTLKITGDILFAAIGKRKLAPNESLLFWEECEIYPKNVTQKVNINVCGVSTYTNYETAINCAYIANGGDTISTCFTNTKATNQCSAIKFDNRSPHLSFRSGYINRNLCYNNQDTLSSQFNANKNSYFMIVGNTGVGTATNVKIELAVRNTAATSTHYLIDKNTLLNNVRIGKISFTAGNFNSIAAPNSLAIQSFYSSSFTSISNCSVSHSETIIPASPFYSSTRLGSYYSIDSLFDAIGKLGLKPNEAIVLVWEGFHQLPKSCTDINLDQWQARINYYDSCEQELACIGSEDWTNNNQTHQVITITGASNTISEHIFGSGVTQIIGLSDDDYSAAPSDRLKFNVPSFVSKLLLPSNTNSQQQSVAVKLEIGALLNVWKGDLYNKNVPCNRPDSSAWYEKNHLRKYVRFYRDTSHTITPSYVQVSPNCIGYKNTGINGYNHYDSAGRPTALNGITDEIWAWFDFPTGFNVKWLNRFYVEVDVQPACAKCACTNTPYISTGYIDTASQKGGSKTPVNISIYHIPNEICGGDTIGVGTNKCTIPNNRYCIFNGGNGIVVQCPGCNIAGLYTINARGSRINFGFEDNDNNGIADNPLRRIIFDQVKFNPILSNGTGYIDNNYLMYHDIFRIRHKSIAHFDDAISSNYYPTAVKLGLPSSSTYANERGFSLGYIRVKTSDSIGLFESKNATQPFSISKSIPALMVWIQDGDVVQTNPNAAYHSGFNAFHQTLYPFQTYSASPSKIDSITPILLYYDSTRDFRDNKTKEFVYDFSLSRLDSAYQQQYNIAQHLPFDYFHNGMKFFFDVTYILSANDGLQAGKLNETNIITRAYFTLSRETKSNAIQFFDMQDAQDTIAYNHAHKSAFIATPALLDSLCPMPQSPYNITVNSVPKNSCDSVRWWCVKGEADFTKIGFDFAPATFEDPDYINTYSMGFCGFVTETVNDGAKRHFLLGQSKANSFSSVTKFSNEYRNWSKAKRFEITGLPKGSTISLSRTNSSNYIALQTPNSVIQANANHTWILDFNNLYGRSTYYPSNPQDSIFLGDDNVENYYSMQVNFNHCSDSTYTMKIKEIDDFNICDYNLNVGAGMLNNFTPTINNNFNNGFGIPLSQNYQNCANERGFEQSITFKAIDTLGLTASSIPAYLNNGSVTWNVKVKQNFAIGTNPWVTMKFPNSWGATNTTITNLTLNGLPFNIAPTGTVNGVSVPKNLGNNTWLFLLPSNLSNPKNQIGIFRTDSNNLFITASYNCAYAPNDSDIVLFNTGIFCDTSVFDTLSSVTSLFASSCERIPYPLILKSLKPNIAAYEDTSQYQNAGLCSDFNMKFVIKNEGNICLKNIRLKVNLPASNNYTLVPAINNIIPVGKNAVIKYGSQQHFIQLTNGVVSLLPIFSTCCNDSSSLPATFLNSCVMPDSCTIEFGIHADCNLTYAPIIDSIWGDGTCGSYKFSQIRNFSSYPVLQNPTHVINAIQPFFGFNNPLNNTCSLQDSMPIYLNNVNNLFSTFNAYNRLLIHVPKGFKIIAAAYSNSSLPLDTLQNSDVCTSTAQNVFGTQHQVSVINLSGLNNQLISFSNPIMLHYVLDSSIACLDTIEAVMVTKQLFVCSATGGSCDGCVPQTQVTKTDVRLKPLIPNITDNTLPCTSKGILIATNTCNYTTWLVNGSVYTSTNDTLLLTNSGTYQIAAMGTLFPHGACQSDTSSFVNTNITDKVVFTSANTQIPCNLTPSGQIRFTITSGISPFAFSVNSSTYTPTGTSLILKNLQSGTYYTQLTDSNNCVSNDTIILPTSAICGNRNICVGSTNTYFVTNNLATSYQWTYANATLISNSPQQTLNIVWNKIGIDTLIVVGTDNTGQIVLTDTALITVVAKPNPTPTLLGGWNTCYNVTPEYNSLGSIIGYDTCFQFCVHNSISFTTPLVSNHVYIWSGTNCNFLSGDSTNTTTILFNSLGAGIINVTETDTLTGCTKTTAICFYIIDQPHAIASCINYPIISGIINVCNQVQLNFADTSSPSTSIINRKWNFGDGTTIINTTNTNISHTYTTGGTYHLTLVVENACHCTDTFKVTVIVNAQSGIPVLCATTVCYADTSTYYANTNSCTTYNWSVSNGTIISGAGTSSIKVVWNGSIYQPLGQVSLSVPSCSTYCSLPTNVTVPIVTPATTVNCPLNMCKNEKVLISVPVVQGNNYSWSTQTPSDVQLLGNPNNHQIWIKAIGNVGATIHLRVSYNNCTMGCSGYKDTTIRIKGAFAVTCLNNNNCKKICSGDSAKFTTDQLTTNSSAMFNWYYTVANSSAIISTVSNTNKASFYFAPVTVMTIYRMYAHAVSTTAFCNSNDPYIEVTVYPLPPKPLLNNILRANCACPSSTIVLTGQPLFNHYFEWSTTNTSANPISSIGNTFSTFMPSSPLPPYTFSVKQVMTDEPHCKSDTLQFSIKKCTAPTLVVTGKNTVCANDISTYLAPIGFDNYSWKIRDNGHGSILAGQGTNQITIQWNSPPVNTSYNAIIDLTTRFCNTSAPNPFSIPVTVMSAMPITLTSNVATICTNNTITFSVNPTVSSASCPLTAPFVWNFGDGSPTVTTNVNKATHTYTTQGTYSVTVAIQNLSSTHILQQATLPITVHLKPEVYMIDLGGGSVCPNPTYNLQGTVTNFGLFTAPNFTYSFFLNGNALSTVPNTLFSSTTAIINGTSGSNKYEIHVKDNNGGCVGISNNNINNCGTGGGASNCQLTLADTLVVTSISCDGSVTFGGVVKTPPYAVTKYTIKTGEPNGDYVVNVAVSANTNYLIPSITHRYKSVGKYPVSIVFDCVGGCSASSNQYVVVPIVADFKVNTICNTSNVKQVNLINLSSALHQPATYTWAGAITSNIANPSPSIIPVGSYTQWLSVLDNSSPQHGCTVGKNFNVSAMPTATIIDSPWVNQCELTPLLFKANTTSKVLGWEWSFDDQLVGVVPHIFYSNLKNPWEAFQYRNGGIVSRYGLVEISLKIVDTMLCSFSTPAIGSSTVWKDTTKRNTMPNILSNGINFTTNPISINCINIGDTIALQVQPKSTLPFSLLNPPFHFTWHNGLPSFNSTSYNASTIIHQSGNYWISVIDGNGCYAASSGSISPQFILTPPINLQGKSSVCAGEAVDYSFDMGNSYTYGWSLYTKANTSILSGTSGSIAIPKNMLLSAQSPYHIIAHMQHTNGTTCGINDTFNIIVNAPPVASIPSINPSSYCIHNGQNVTLTANATGGHAPYTYYWMNGVWGMGLSQLSINQGGQYGFHVVDSLGCSSSVAYANIKPAPDFSGLITGCLNLCDTDKVCGAIDINYPNSNWLYNGMPVNNNLVGSNNALHPALSGFYQQVMCNNTGTCCDTSAIVDIQVSACSQCCAADIITIDSTFCVGQDNAGNIVYQCRINIVHNCPTPATIQTQSTNGNISLGTYTILSGNNTIYGTITAPASQGQFCCVISTVGSFDTCVFDMPCVTLTNTCNVSAPCNMSIIFHGEKCYGIDRNGNPMYVIWGDVVNANSVSVNYTINTTEGILSSNTGTVSAGSNQSFYVVFTDTLSYTGFMCLYLDAIDPVTNQPCSNVTCFALNSSANCIQTNGCIFDAFIEGFTCIGYDALGNPQYQINLWYNSPFGYTNPSIQLSIVNTNGFITLPTPNAVHAGINSVPFIFTNTSNNPHQCFKIIVTDMASGGISCMADTLNPNLCVDLPVCPQYRLTHTKPHQATKPLQAIGDKNTDCMVKIVPNPNEGKPVIYYKIALNDEQQVVINNSDLQIAIIQSSTGKIVYQKLLDNAAGIIYFVNEQVLAEGHYTVILRHKQNVWCETKMEVIKR